MRRILTLALALLLPSLGWATEESKDLKVWIYRVPSSSFMKPMDAKGESGGLLDGVKKINSSPFYGDGDVYDVQSFLKMHGIEFSEGAQALFVERQGILWVKDTAKNIGRLSDLFDSGTCDPPILLRNEIFVVQFKSQQKNLENGSLTLSELVKAAGHSWKQVSSLEIVSRSGEIVKAATSSGTFAPSQVDEILRAPEMQPNDSGATCAIENIVGPDGFNIDSKISFRYQSAKSESNGPLTIAFNGSSAFWDGHPQILQYVANDGNQPSYAVIMRINIVFPDTSPLKQVDKNHPVSP